MGDENLIRTLGDYSKRSHEGYKNTIELPVGNNVVPIRSDTIRLVQNRCSFYGLWSKDPNNSSGFRLKHVDSLTLDGSITTWEDLTTRFLAQFFSPGRTTKLHNDILMFQQHHGESLSEAWTHFKDLLQKSPHIMHQPYVQVQIFYDHVNPVTRRTIDQAADVVPTTLNIAWKIPSKLLSTTHPRVRMKWEKKLSHLRTQLEQQQDDMIGKINLLWKTVSEMLNNVSTPENARNSMASKSIEAISHAEKEELRKNGIKSLSKLFSPKYLSLASIKELNKNLSALKRVHFVNSIIILSKDSDIEEEDVSSINVHEHDLGNMMRNKEEVKEKGKEEDEMETDEEVEEVF
ncbi:zinc finger, CCHC-type containing protein [Tanacetum coccineum]